jgi:hypothetical protein
MSDEALARCCKGCHFLAKLTPPNMHTSRSDSSPSSSELSDFDRECLAGGPPASSVVGESSSIACYLHVWDQGYLTTDGQKKTQTEIISGERGESCFFYPYTPGMLFPAAVELERRQSNRREAERDRELTRQEGNVNRTQTARETGKDRRLTRRLVWITAGALLLSFVTTGVSCLDRWQHDRKHDAPHGSAPLPQATEAIKHESPFSSPPARASSPSTSPAAPSDR